MLLPIALASPKALSCSAAGGTTALCAVPQQDPSVIEQPSPRSLLHVRVMAQTSIWPTVNSSEPARQGLPKVLLMPEEPRSRSSARKIAKLPPPPTASDSGVAN